MIEGELESLDGSWELEDLGSGRTRVTYALDVDPGSIPRLVRGPIDRPFVPPRLLQAIDLKTGKLIWERPVEGKQLLPPVP